MKRMKVHRKRTPGQWLRENRWSIAVLAVAAVLFIVVGYAARPEPEAPDRGAGEEEAP